MPPSSGQIARYRRLIGEQRYRTSAALVAAWDGLDSITDETDVDLFVRRTAPTLIGAKAAVVATSAAFFALATGTRPVAVRPDAVPVEARIRHPFLSAWHALAEDRPFDEAIQAGRSQASAVGFDFVQSTSRRTGDVVADRAGRTRVRWQRVPGPKACAWCELVAGQLYTSAESADFGHDRCDCVAVPA